MTLLLITEIFPPKPGGSGRWFWEIYRRFPRGRVIVAAGEDPRQCEFDETQDVRIIRLPLSLPSWGILDLGALRIHRRLLGRLLKLAGSERVEMVHAGKCLPEGLIALCLNRLAGRPYACYAHGEELNAAAGSRELAWLARKVLRSARFVIANSRNTRRMLEEDWGVSREQVYLMNPGVDTRRFAPAPRWDDVRAELGWGNRTVIMTAGRLQKRKGHDRMIASLAAIRDAVPDVLYAILGDGEERGPLVDLVSRVGMEGHVQFLGERDDETLIRCYQQCDLFALPNRSVGGDIEGFGMVLVEAQACGRPVLAGDSGGTAETMRIPETGIIVPCDEVGPLAAAVIDLLSDRDRLARMGAAARVWAVEQFDWETLVVRAERLFRTESSVSMEDMPVPS